MKEKVLIYCECGCGKLLENRDERGRFRTMFWGHQNARQKQLTRDRLKGKPSFFKGKHHSEEAKKKLRECNLGREDSLEVRLKRSVAMKGKSHPQSLATRELLRQYRMKQVFPPETGEKLSRKTKERWANPEYKERLTLVFRKHWADPERRAKHIKALTDATHLLTGEKSHSWRGGLSFMPYTQSFNKCLKLKIRKRDHYECQLCGMPEIENRKSLTVHHIDYDKAYSYEENLISLCVSCNTKVNYSRDYWAEYFGEMLKGKQVEMVVA